jgi:RNA polymerase sigma-70 factor (ECF subfamily)
VSEELAELVKRCEAGDDNALASLIRRFQPVSLELARALLDDRDLAEDVVQETFITALQRLPELRQADAFPA